MGRHGKSTVEVTCQFFQHRMRLGVYDDRPLEKLAEEHRLYDHITNEYGRNGQEHQGKRHHPRSLVRLLTGSETVVMIWRCLFIILIAVMHRMAMIMTFMRLAKTLFPVEHEEIHAEGIESGDKNPGHHREIGKSGTVDVRQLHRLDDRILGVETGKEWRPDQGQRADQRRQPGHWHVFPEAPHIADILIMVHADDHRAGGQEQQSLEEGVRHQMENGHRVGRGA